MSLLVKGLKMPENCGMCGMAHRTFDGNETKLACYALLKWADDSGDGRLKDCPLVEIPVPHGDLIDKEKLYNTTANLEAQALAQVEKLIHSEDISEWKRWSATLNERTAFKHDLLDAQIVVEAEKKDKI